MKTRFLNLISNVALCATLLVIAAPLWAGPGHDGGHDGAAGDAAVTGNGPKRLPDGSVFLPKPAQRQLAVRTVQVVAGALPRSLELAGRVVMDPNAGGMVQAVVAGRIEPGPRGLPSVGQVVNKGEVLAYVIPSSGVIERSNQMAQMAELRAAQALAGQRLVRLQALSDTVPRKEMEAAQSEVSSLGARVAAVAAGLSNRDALLAPVSGVIASSHVVAGQVLDARELAFEVVDPTRLQIEALAYDLELAGNIEGATLVVGSERVALVFVGAARSLREQALPMVFRAQGAALSRLAIGQPVKVFVQTRSRVQGLRVPAQALMKNPANETIVWVKTAPERFEPRTVTLEPLDGTWVAVTSGLQANDRVATQAASLINQIR